MSSSLSAIIESVGATETNYIRLISTVSATALLLYDILLTFDRELDIMWCRGLTRLSVLFAINRYLELASYVSFVVLIFPVSDQTCYALGLFGSIMLLFPYIAWATFLGFRAYALSNRNISLGLLVFAFGANLATPSIYSLTQYTAMNLAPPTGCWVGESLPDLLVFRGLLFSSRATVIIADIIVISLTWKNIAGKSLWPSQHPRTLVQVLHKNGMLCFVVPLVLHIFSLVTDSIDSTTIQTSVSQLRDAIISILVSRFLFDLSEIGVGDNLKSRQPSGVLTTEWTHDISEVPSVVSVEDYEGPRPFDEDDDELSQCSKRSHVV